MKRFALYVALALVVALPGVVIRLAGIAIPPPLAVLVYGVAVASAGFLLSWGAEAEIHVSAGLIIAVLAIVTVLPEYSLDIYLAYQAGVNPASPYAQYAAANMTGANRLLVGTIWPLLILLFWWRSGQRHVPLTWANSPEIVALGLASLFAFIIVIERRIDLLDTVILIGLFALYVWRISRLPRDEDEEEAVGPSAILATLPMRIEHTIIAVLTIAAAAIILLVTESFAEALIDTGKVWGIDQFLLIQWLGPLASEAPIIVVTVLFATRNKPTTGLASLISDKINQWTLLVGMLPIAYSIGAGQLAFLPLDARQREEFFLTAAQSLFGVALLLRLRLDWKGAVSLLVLFLVQFGLAFVLRGNDPLVIRVLTWMAWLYLALAAGVLIWSRTALIEQLRVGLLNQPPPEANGAAGRASAGAGGSADA